MRIVSKRRLVKDKGLCIICGPLTEAEAVCKQMCGACYQFDGRHWNHGPAYFARVYAPKVYRAQARLGVYNRAITQELKRRKG